MEISATWYAKEKEGFSEWKQIYSKGQQMYNFYKALYPWYIHMKDRKQKIIPEYWGVFFFHFAYQLESPDSLKWLNFLTEQYFWEKYSIYKSKGIWWRMVSILLFLHIEMCTYVSPNVLQYCLLCFIQSIFDSFIETHIIYNSTA